MIGGVLFYGVAVVCLVIIAGLFVSIALRQRKQAIARSLSYRLLLVKLPRSEEGSERNFKEDINRTEQFFTFLSSTQDPISLEVAVPYVGEEIHFYISVPQKMVQSLSRRIEGLFKDAVIEDAPEYTVFHEQGVHAGAYCKQQRHYSLPINTYVDVDTDTFSPIVSGLSKINEVGEGAALQVVLRPAPDTFKKRIVSMINDVRKGESFQKISSSYAISMDELISLFGPQHDKEDGRSIVDEEALKMLSQKIAKPLVQVNYRIIVSSPSAYQTDAVMDGITSGFSQFEAPLKNSIVVAPVKNIKQFAYSMSFRVFDPSKAMILNTQELASMIHFPSSSMLSSKIQWLKSKQASPTFALPQEGTPIGSVPTQGQPKMVRIGEDDRRRHVYIIGQTGTGKSTLVENMALDDIQKGKGVAVIDPHGDLVETLLGLIPPERNGDVVVFDPSSLSRPIGLNMLEYNQQRPEEKTFIVNEIQGIFNKLFSQETMGPMFEQYMRNALLLLMEDMQNEPATLMEVPRIFTDEDYRMKKLERIANPVVIDFWTKEVAKVGGEASLSNMAPYITSKFNNFIANDYVRPIIGQAQSSFSVRSIMDEKKILLVNLSKGKIGDINAGLLGMIVVGKLLMAALSRADMPEGQRSDFQVYIDEFQNFTTDSIGIILSEARKYRLNLTIAHQFIAQLEDKVRDAVFGNVGSMIAFRVGANDAQSLENQFAPVFSQQDLMNIDNYRAHAKLLIGGQTTRPFTIMMHPHPPTDIQLAHSIKERSLKQYGRDRIAVERDILGRLRM